MADIDGMCEIRCIHEDIVAKVKVGTADGESFYRIAEFFKALGDPARVKILYALSAAELCVCDIANILGATESAVSHQLRILRNLRLVKFRKESRVVYYSLDDDHVRLLLEQGMEHVRER